MDKRAENRAILRDSLEMAHLQGELTAILLPIVLTFIPFLLSFGNDPEALGLWATVVGLCLLPLVIFWIQRILRIFWKAEDYIFSKTVLNAPHSGALRNSMRFTVLVRDEYGYPFPADTHSIFVTHGFVPPLLEDYINKTVTVGYNPKTHMVVVIG